MTSAPCRSAISCGDRRRLRLGDRQKRAFVQLVVPDQLVVRPRGERPLGQDDQLQQRLPFPAGVVDHPLVRQELVQIAPHRPVVIVIRRPEVRQQHPDLRALRTGGMIGGGMGKAALARGSRRSQSRLRSGHPAWSVLPWSYPAGHKGCGGRVNRPWAKAVSGTPSASASRALADPGRKGCCWLSCGAQPVRNIKLEGRPQATLRRARSSPHRSRRPRHSTARRGEPAQPGGKGVGLAHRAQVGASRLGSSRYSTVWVKLSATGRAKPGALHQRAQIADFAHRQDAGREAARHLRLGLGQAGAQFLQRPPAGQDREEQARRVAARGGIGPAGRPGSFAQCSAIAWITRSCAPGVQRQQPRHPARRPHRAAILPQIRENRSPRREP